MENIKLNFAHICENAFFSIDKKLSIINIFEIINTPQLPASFPKFSVAFSLSSDDLSNFKPVVEITNPQGEIILHSDPKLKLGEDKKTANLVINIVNFSFKEEGKYKFLLKDGENLIDDNNYLNIKKI